MKESLKMIYVMSDLHGCIDPYREMLEKINLSDDDTLYILGDVADRGEDGIAILQDMMERFNIIPILGNHDFIAYTALKKLCTEITDENIASLSESDLLLLQDWVKDGGKHTITAFSKLSQSEKEDMLEYLSEFELYEELTVNGKSFVLTHAGLGEFSPEKPLEDYTMEQLIFMRADYEKVYYPDKYLVTGHTPTFLIDKSRPGKIYKNNNHIAIDCGFVFGRALGCICLDTMEEFYVE